MAAAAPLVTDPSLQSVLAAADLARTQSLAILDLLDAHHAADSDPDPTSQQLALSVQQRKLETHLAQLRGLNRRAVLGVRSTKQETGEARQEIDALHLQLQNLYYEQRHLRGEITGCEEYDHIYTNLPLTSTEEFLVAHPEHADSDEHDLTIARIQDEHAARQQLEEQRQVLQKRKEALLKETNAKKEDLGKLDAEMEKWIAGESNVRKIFDAKEKKARDAEERANS
ncbi:hypothetical protein WHR41_03065 [Cladosporium halotolerans]|uniref:Uncharacterized protein n=1 Tax=Cladosporium halotolerans TaxID=1052096 RepID=A0AB34KWE6_9PEZI